MDFHVKWYSAILYAFILLAAVDTQRVRSKRQLLVVVEIEPAGQTTVRIGQNLTILCRVGVPLDACRVEIPDSYYRLSRFLFPGVGSDGISYYGESLESGQCGVHIASVKRTHDGTFKCSLTPKGSKFESSATTKIIVAKPPMLPELTVSEGTRGRHVYEKGQVIRISCRAHAGQPAADVSLFLDDEPIGNDERPTIYDVDSDAVAVKNVTRNLDWSDNGKTLRCVADHIALERPLAESVQLTVEFAPQPRPTIERFGYVIGQPGIVIVTVRANPRPHFIWHIDDEAIDEGHPDISNRIETSSAVEIGRGLWDVTLRIDSVQKSDTEKNYTLEARNAYGAAVYTFKLSARSEPTEATYNRSTLSHEHAGAFNRFYVIFSTFFIVIRSFF